MKKINTYESYFFKVTTNAGEKGIAEAVARSADEAKKRLIAAFRLKNPKEQIVKTSRWSKKWKMLGVKEK